MDILFLEAIAKPQSSIWRLPQCTFRLPNVDTLSPLRTLALPHPSNQQHIFRSGHSMDIHSQRAIERFL